MYLLQTFIFLSATSIMFRLSDYIMQLLYVSLEMIILFLLCTESSLDDWSHTSVGYSYAMSRVTNVTHMTAV